MTTEPIQASSETLHLLMKLTLMSSDERSQFSDYLNSINMVPPPEIKSIFDKILEADAIIRELINERHREEDRERGLIK